MDSPFFAGKREVKAKPYSYQADQKKKNKFRSMYHPTPPSRIENTPDAFSFR
jgi:hypothetical protein